MSDYPKLLWNHEGREVVVESAHAEAHMAAQGYRPSVAEALASEAMPEPEPDDNGDAEKPRTRRKH